MNFSSIKSITIPEGLVKKIETGGKVLWEEPVSYKNQVPISIDTDKSIFNGKGWVGRTRLSSSGVTKSGDYTSTTGYIPVKSGDVVRIQGVSYDDNSDYICAYKSDFSFLAASSGNNGYTGLGNVTVTNGIATLILPNNNNMAYIRVSAKHDSADAKYGSVASPVEGPGSYLIVTINEEIV